MNQPEHLIAVGDVGLDLNPTYAAMGARRIHRPHAPAERPPAPTRGQQTLFD